MTIEERIAKLEAQQETDNKNTTEIWESVSNIRDKFEVKEKEMREHVSNEISKVCLKLDVCQRNHDKNIEYAIKEVILKVDSEIKALRDTVDKVWSITWKALSLIAVVILAMAGWNITLMTRMSGTEAAVSKINANIEVRRQADSELLIALKDIRTEMKKMNGGD